MDYRRFVKFGLSPSAIILILLAQMMAVAFEGVGLGMLLPVVEFLQAGNDPERLGAHWAPVLERLRTLGLSVNLAALLVLSFAAIVLRQLFMYWRLTYVAGRSLWLVTATREHAFKRLLAAKIAVVEGDNLGTLANDLTIEAERAVACIFNAITAVGYGLQILFYGCLLLWLSLPMTVMSAATMGLAALLLRGQFRRSRLVGGEVTRANRELSTFLLERLRSLRLIRLSHTETAEIDGMQRFNADQRQHVLYARVLGARIAVLVEPIVVAAGFSFLYVGSKYAGLQLGEISLFVLIVFRLLPVVKELMVVRQSVLATTSSLDAVEGRLDDLAAAAEHLGGGRPVPPLGEGIRFERVGYTYPGSGSPALREVDMVLSPGVLTALVGPSGSGKSTLIDMLPRLREPDCGQIRIGGVPLTDVDLPSLRRAIGYVPQSAQVFNVPLREHIRYGRPDATEDEIWEAARLAAADEFIRALPEGLDTLAGEGGGRLSGGQRQRLDLARALIGKPSILVLDEPTSALDPASEELFRQSLKRLCAEQGVTIIMVGHRPSMISVADFVVVLEAGRVTQAGAPDALLASEGWYARTFDRPAVAADTNTWKP